MIAILLLAALLVWPVPPLGATLGDGTPTPYHSTVSATATQQTILPAIGLATYYNSGVFEKVLAVRGLPADGCPDCDGYAALLWPEDLGRFVCVQGLRLWVVDSAAEHHGQALIEKGWIVDLDRETWRTLGFPDTPTLVFVTEC